MRKTVPVNKMSAKKRKEYYSKDRASWFGVVPVTKVVPNKKAYDRKRAVRMDRSGFDD